MGSVGVVALHSDDLTQLSDRLDAVQAAMKRLDAGTYGACEGCESPIDDERLEADPTATHCASCMAAVPMIDLADSEHSDG